MAMLPKILETTMAENFDPTLRGDLEVFLEDCGLKEILSLPQEQVAVAEFPVSDRRVEHRALSSLVARVLRIQRLVARHTSVLTTLDERDLVREQLDPGLREWWRDVGQALLVRLALLDSRERLTRLLQLAEEGQRMKVLERPSVTRLRETPEELGAAGVIADWLLSELREISSLQAQVTGLPTEFLPQPAWHRYLELREDTSQLDAVIGLCDASLEADPRVCEAYLQKHHALDELLGGLPAYDGFLDFADDEFGAASPAESQKYGRVRKVLGDALAFLSDDQKDSIVNSFPSMASLNETIEEADRLTDRGNALWEFMGTDFFRPEDWKANRDALRPLLLKHPQFVHPEIRAMLMDVAHAFVLGQWAAVSALSRALLERAVKVNWVDLGYATKGSDGQIIYKTLDAMTRDLSQKFSSLKRDMRRVRQHGNRIMHDDRTSPAGGAGERATRMAQLREEALGSIESLYRVLEGLPKQ
jgi:hypothetical protein